MRRQSPGVLRRRGRGASASTEGGVTIGADNVTVMPILNHVFSFQSRGHQSGSRRIYFLVISANNYLGHEATLGQVQGLFCPR